MHTYLFIFLTFPQKKETKSFSEDFSSLATGKVCVFLFWAEWVCRRHTQQLLIFHKFNIMKACVTN